MKWDLNRLAQEVEKKLARGENFKQVGRWLDPLEKAHVSRRQFVGKVPHEGEAQASPHYLRVVVDEILWEVDGTTNKAVGFVLRGCVFRHKTTGEAADGQYHARNKARRGQPAPLVGYYSSSSSFSSWSISSSSSSSPVGKAGGPGFK